jgi:hypothetical protein
MLLMACLRTKFPASSCNNLLVNAKEKAKYKFRAAATLFDFLQKITLKFFKIYHHTKFKDWHKCHIHLGHSHN